MSVPSANTRASRNVRSTASQPLIEKPASKWSGCAGVETALAIVPMTRLSSCSASSAQAIAWALLALQLLSLVIGTIAKAVSTPAHPLHLDAGFSINGWLAVLLTFLLARVFAEGTLMREDLEGMV